MEINYKRDRSYSADDVKELFLFVDWLSGKYTQRLKKALDNCETVITAYVHYLCVNPKFYEVKIWNT